MYQKFSIYISYVTDQDLIIHLADGHPSHFVLHLLVSTLSDEGGSSFPHEQPSPLVKANAPASYPLQ